MKYQVLVQHFGDKQYWAGDVREIDNEQDVQVLIKMGLIAPFDDDGDNGEQDKNEQNKPLANLKAKAKLTPKNKAETDPQNKADDNGKNHA